MLASVLDVPDPLDGAVGVEQVGDPLRVGAVTLVLLEQVEAPGQDAALVRREREAEAALLPKLLVPLVAVDADADHLVPRVAKPLVAIVERLGLHRAAGREVGRVEPDDRRPFGLDGELLDGKAVADLEHCRNATETTA